MTSRERVLAAVAHRQPDRVPMALHFAPELSDKLKARLGMNDAALADWVGLDIVGIGPVFRRPACDKHYADPTIEVTPEGHYLDIYRVPFRLVRTEFQTYMELAGRPPLRDCASAADLARHPWPDADWWDYSGMPAQAKAHRDKATWGHSRGFFEIAHFMRGMEGFMTDLALRPDLACALMDRILEYLLARTRRQLETLGGSFTFFEYNDDVASQRGLFISPEMWRRLVKPRMKRMCDLIHGFGPKVRYHSCGSVRAIIPDLIEIGVDILNPVQSLAAGMDPFELKAEFGDRLTLDGGVDIQELLPRASAGEVRRHVRRLIDVVGKDGGYFLGGSHVVQADVPVENVLAVVEEARMPPAGAGS